MRFVFATLISLVLASVSYPQVLNVGECETPQTLNPLFSKGEVGRRIRSLIFRSPIVNDAANNPRMFLFEEPEEEPDPTKKSSEWRFILRDNLQWQDGKPITFNDLQFSRWVAGSDQSRYKDMVADITQMTQGKKNEVIVQFIAPTNAPTASLMFPLLPKHKFKEGTVSLSPLDNYGRNSENKPIGCGPYEMTYFEPNRKGFRFKRFVNYELAMPWGEIPRRTGMIDFSLIDEVKINVYEDPKTAVELLQNGTLDVLTVVQPEYFTELKNSKNIKLTIYPAKLFCGFVFNCDPQKGEPNFATNEQLRIAIDLAMPRSKFQEKFSGIIEGDADQYIPNGPFWTGGDDDIHYRTQDITRAKQILEEQGCKLPKGGSFREINGKRVVLRFATWVRERKQTQICQDFINVITKDLNIYLEIHNDYDLKKFEEVVLQNRDFDIAYDNFSFERNYDFVRAIFSSEGSENYCGYKNSEFDKHLNSMLSATDQEERELAIMKVHKIYYYKVPAIFVLKIPRYAASRTDKITGFDPGGLDFYNTISSWFLKG